MEKGWFIGNSGETRLMIRHRQAFHQFPKRYRTLLDFSLFPLYPLHNRSKRAWGNPRASALRRFRWKRNDGESKRIVAFSISTVYRETN
jgi:hypothetical protein